ncbi:unnamed protein product, partial [Brassica rapa subsp. trilocularis]
CLPSLSFPFPPMKLQRDLFSTIYQKRCRVFKAISSKSLKLKDTKWLSRQDLYVFLEYNETLTSYRRNSSSWWSSCSESAVAAGQSLRRRFSCRE